MRNVSGRSYGPNQNKHFFLEWETFRAEVMDQIKTRISCSKHFTSKVMPFMRSCRKNCGAGQDTDNTTQAHCMVDTWGYKYKLRIGNIYWFFHSNNDWMEAPQCYEIRTKAVLLSSCEFWAILSLFVYEAKVYSCTVNVSDAAGKVFWLFFDVHGTVHRDIFL